MIKNLKIRKALELTLLVGGLSLVTTGCNYDLFDTQYNFNKIVVFGENSATIYEIDSWTDYDGEQIQVKTKDGFYFVTSSYDSKLIDETNSNRTAEDFAKSIKGEDVEIYYWDSSSNVKLK